MKLSVIVPVYNMAEGDRLKHCLDSLLGQSLKDMEIIAVDDASTDSSPDILKEYEGRLNAIRPGALKIILSKENHRQGGARNRGMELADGEWIGFMDSDDYADPLMFEKLIRCAEETGADVCGCDYELVSFYGDKNGKPVANNTIEQTGVLDDDKHKSLILRGGSSVTKIYRASLIKDNELSFPEDIFYEDNCAAPLWSMYFKNFAYVPEPLYKYLTVQSSTTHTVSVEKCRDRMEAGRIFILECKKRDLYERYKEEIDYRFTELSYVTTLFSYMYSGRGRKPSFTAEIKRYIREILPDFLDNKYLSEYTDKENLSFIKLQQKSNILFFIKYVLLFKYRELRK